MMNYRHSAERAQLRWSGAQSLSGVMMMSLLLAAAPGWADDVDRPTQRPGTHMNVTGVVSHVQPDLLTVKTSWGRVRIASATAPNNLEVGEEVEMQVNENNVVVDVHRKGDPSHSHRFVSGKLAYASLDRREIKLWTPEGEKIFAVQTGRSQLSGVSEGTPIAVELNEAGKVIDIHRLTVELEIDEHPHTLSGSHLTLNGEVTKIQSGLVYVQTPVGRYTISEKTAPPDAAVGDEVTLWLNEENMVIDHHGKHKNKPGAHRLITGKLVYAGLTKKEIKLWTPEGEKVFPLDRMEVKTKPIAEGTTVIVELDESGRVIDLRKAAL
ncbi:MAG: conserved exported protein of unknown function [Nitrospira sp.]|nr:hypothetical protein [Nitrospira sp.]ULA60708.1 MAG: conserved exported protein of unknown function [Nitrospira sp.]